MAADLLAELGEFDLDSYTIVGRYARFDAGQRATLDEFRQRVEAASKSRQAKPENFLVWGPPGSGKSFLVQEIARSLAGTISYAELNLSQLDELQFRSQLKEAWGDARPIVILIDEVDALPGAGWPYEFLLGFLDPTVPRQAPTVFVLAGSGGASSEEMRRGMESRSKGRDLLSRIPAANEYHVDPLGVGDRMLVAAVQFSVAAGEANAQVRDIEKLALYYVATTPTYSSARQLRALADQTARRIPEGEHRLRYDHLFRPGDLENKEFWSRTRPHAAELAGAYLHLKPALPVTAQPGPVQVPPPSHIDGPPKQSSGGPTGAGRSRIAILPFRNISPDPNDAYLAEGLTEELIEAIGRVPGVEVVSMASVSRFRRTPDRTAGEIGRELRARSLLDGSVRKSANRLRISTQFIDATQDRQLWSNTFDGDVSDVFAMQKDIATRVSHALATDLGKDVETASPARDLEAYLLFLRARAAFNEATLESMQKAIELYKAAIAREPKYAEAFAGIASCYARIGFWEMAPSRDALARSRSAAEQALAINPDLEEARLIIVRLYGALDWDYASAEREARDLVARHPRSALAHLTLANVLKDNLEESAREARIGVELDPDATFVREAAGIAMLYARLYREAMDQFSITLELNPKDSSALHNFGLAKVQAGEFTEGVKMMEEALQRSSEPSPIQEMELAYGYLRASRPDAAMGLLTQIETRAAANPVWWAAAAGVYANLERFDDTFVALEKARVSRASFLVSHLTVDFIFDPIRQDPRYPEFLERTIATGKQDRHATSTGP